MENIGAKVDIYLAMSHPITVITTTSYLSGTVHIFSVRQQHPSGLYMAETYHPARQSERDLAALAVMGVEKPMRANWEKTITHNVPK